MTGQPAEDWAVVGGGILGQVLALRLRQAGHQVTLIEAAPDLGGLAAAWSVGDVTYDKFYHVVLPFDDRLLALLDEIGLGDEVVWKTTRTGFFSDGRLVSLDGALDFLRLKSIGIVSKLRLATLLVMAARVGDGDVLDKIAVRDWLQRWCGRACYDRLWHPLLRAKLGGNAEAASAAFIWASMRRLYLARKGSRKVEKLGYVRHGGYRRILDALRARLDDSGVVIRTGTPVNRIFRSAGSLCVQTPGGTHRFRNVVSTLSTTASLRVCEGLDPDETARLGSVVYQGILCATVLLDRPLGGYYLTYLTDQTLPFTAIVEMSALTGTEAFGGRTLVYLPRYAAQDDPYWALDDDEIAARFIAGLGKVHPGITRANIVDLRCARVREVMAVPTIGYRTRVPDFRTSVPGLYLANSAQIIDGTLNVDATLGVADRVLPLLLSETPGDAVRSAA